MQRGAEFSRDFRTRFRTRARAQRERWPPPWAPRDDSILLENRTARFPRRRVTHSSRSSSRTILDSERSPVDVAGAPPRGPTSREFEVSRGSSGLSTGAATQLSLATSSIATGSRSGAERSGAEPRTTRTTVRCFFFSSLSSAEYTERCARKGLTQHSESAFVRDAGAERVRSGRQLT